MVTSLNKYINLIRGVDKKIFRDLEVKSLWIFGSIARGEETDNSDVDIFVDMPPKAMKMVELKFFLQDLLGRDIDLVRSRNSLDPYFLKQIQKDGVLVI